MRYNNRHVDQSQLTRNSTKVKKYRGKGSIANNGHNGGNTKKPPENVGQQMSGGIKLAIARTTGDLINFKAAKGGQDKITRRKIKREALSGVGNPKQSEWPFPNEDDDVQFVFEGALITVPVTFKLGNEEKSSARIGTTRPQRTAGDAIGMPQLKKQRKSTPTKNSIGEMRNNNKTSGETNAQENSNNGEGRLEFETPQIPNLKNRGGKPTPVKAISRGRANYPKAKLKVKKLLQKINSSELQGGRPRKTRDKGRRRVVQTKTGNTI